MNNLLRIALQIYVQRGNLFAIPLKKPRVEIKIQEANTTLKTFKGSSPISAATFGTIYQLDLGTVHMPLYFLSPSGTHLVLGERRRRPLGAVDGVGGQNGQPHGVQHGG